MKKLTIYSIIAAALLAASGNAFAQSKITESIQIDKTIHDFGDIFVDDGPVTCTYTVTNTGDKAFLILSAVSSCGCTQAEWTKEPVLPGKTGTVTATFNNEDGPYPFDKTVTVYFSETNKPTVLHLRGSVHKASTPLKERYTLMFGNFGVKDLEFNVGNLSQGERKAVDFVIANNGVTPMSVEFKNVSENMTINVYPNPVPAKSTATMEVTIRAHKDKYGLNWYYATPVIDGREYRAVGKRPAKEKAEGAQNIYTQPNKRLGIGKSEIGFYASTKERYAGYEEGVSPEITFTKSTMSFGKLTAGSKTTVTFEYKNIGKEESKIHKVDAGCSNVTVKQSDITAGGKKGQLVLDLDTTGMPKGENIIVLNLFTNSPSRPIITLQLVGEII